MSEWSAVERRRSWRLSKFKLSWVRLKKRLIDMRHVTLRQLRTFAEVRAHGQLHGCRAGAAPHAAGSHPADARARTARRPAAHRAHGGRRRADGSRARSHSGSAAHRARARRVCGCAVGVTRLAGWARGNRRSEHGEVLRAAGARRVRACAILRSKCGWRSATARTIIAALEANTLDLALTGRPPEDLGGRQGADRRLIRTSSSRRPIIGWRRASASPPAMLAEETFLVRERAQARAG